MIMRDVLDELEELACAAALGSGPQGFQALSIEPPACPARQAPVSDEPGRVVNLDWYRYKKVG
jgi:hypothetical protein